jgi:hypothetical protein
MSHFFSVVWTFLLTRFIIISEFFLYIFLLWTVANLNGGVEEGALHAQADGVVPELNLSSTGMLEIQRNSVNDLFMFQFIKFYHIKTLKY